jgi:hypothetical protein
MGTLQITAVSNAVLRSAGMLSDAFDPSYEGMNSLVLPHLQGFYNIDMSETGSQITATIPLQIGAAVSGSPITEQSKNFRWALKDFTLENYQDFTFGDLVYFNSGANQYNSTISKVDITNVEKGATKGLFIFHTYLPETKELHLIHKGFVDFPVGDPALDSFITGETLYIGSDSTLSVIPGSSSGNWVRSVGLCVPSKDNTIQRVWFDPDSTYILLV